MNIKRFIAGCPLISLFIFAGCGPEDLNMGFENYNVSFQVKQTICVQDYGAAGDGIKDDGPAIEAAFKAAMDLGGNVCVQFESKKTYFIGERLDRWQVFILKDFKNVMIDGNGSELVFNRANNTFQIIRCSGVILKNLNMSYKDKIFVQGTVTAVDMVNLSFDIKLEDGSPKPPSDAWMLANNGGYPGTGGQHGLLIRSDAPVRKTTAVNHFKFNSIKDLGGGVYRFFAKNEYRGNIPSVAIQDRFVYNPGFSVLTAVQRNRPMGLEAASFLISESRDIQLANVNLFATPVKGIRTYDNEGPIVLRKVGLRLRPDSDALLAVGSDGIHAKNNRGPLIVEECWIERANDDLFNLSNMPINVTGVAGDDKVRLVTSEIIYYNYSIKAGDRLEFFDEIQQKVLGTATVASIVPGTGREWVVTLDVPVPQLLGNTPVKDLLAMNLNQLASGTVVRGNTFRPLLRSTMLAHPRNAVIKDNVIDSLGGGGFNFIWAATEGPFSREHSCLITGNIIQNTEDIAIQIGNPNLKSKSWRSDILIESNVITGFRKTGIKVINESGVVLRSNRISIPSDAAASTIPVSLVQCSKIEVDGLTVDDPRAGSTQQAVTLDRCIEGTVQIKGIVYNN